MLRLLGRIQPLEAAGSPRHACQEHQPEGSTQDAPWHQSQESAIKPNDLPVLQQHIRTSTMQQLSTAQHSVLYQLLAPAHHRMQKYQTEHHHATEMVERHHALCLPHDASTNARQGQEEAAGTPIRQHVTHQLLTTHTPVLLAAVNRGITNQSAPSGLEQVSTRQVPTSQSSICTQSATRGSRGVVAEAAAPFPKAPTEEI